MPPQITTTDPGANQSMVCMAGGVALGGDVEVEDRLWLLEKHNSSNNEK